jgi:hypothetical protein
VALNPLAIIAGPESSFGTNLYNPTSSATGIWQDLTGTWAYALQGIGLSPSQYPTAASAPPSVQAAANAYLYNQQGFAPWAPYDQALAQQIAALGGPSAFMPPGSLSTNPADYAALDQPSGLQAFFSNPSNPPISLSADVASPQVASQLFPTGGFGAEMGYPNTGAAPYLGYTVDPTTGAITPYDYGSGLGGSSASASGSGATGLNSNWGMANTDYSTVNPASTQSWWQTLVSGITSELERIGIMGFGVILVVAAAFVLMWPHVKEPAKKAAAALA